MNYFGKKEIGFIVIGFLLLLAGLFYYLAFRDIDQIYLGMLPGVNQLQYFLSGIPLLAKVDYMQSLPTFVHGLALSLITAGLLRADRKGLFFASLLWLCINLLYEAGQIANSEMHNFLAHNFLISGVFDWNDIVAAFLAFSVVNLLGLVLPGSVSSGMKKPFMLRFASYCIFVLGTASLMGTSAPYCESSYSECGNYKTYDPIYLSYADLRSSVSTSNESTPTEFGKVYIYRNYLLVNSRNSGIHVYDNQDANNPLYLTFINIPGNIDLAVKNGYLYADSYIDLVVIDLTDAENIREIFRIENVFAYDPYQNIPDGIYLNGYDREKGVVIGYKEKQS